MPDRNGAKPIRVLIIQGFIPHYRIPIFNFLGNAAHLQVTVLHSGTPTADDHTTYTEIIAPRRSVGPFYLQAQVTQIADQADVIIAMFDFHWLSTVALLLRKHTYKLIWWGIGLGNNKMLDQLRLLAVKFSDALILYAASAQTLYTQNGIPAAKIFIAPNTLDVQTPQINRDPQTRKNLLFIGSLQPRKQLADLLIAFKGIVDIIPPDVNIDIVGSGPEEARLRQLCTELTLSDRVTFYGALTDEEKLRGFFHHAIATVSPGQAGLSVLHSFANGVLFITSRQAISGGEIENIQQGVNGFLYDGSIEQLTNLLLQVIQTPGLAVELGQNAYNYYVNQRTIAHMGAGFIAAIQYVRQAKHPYEQA